LTTGFSNEALGVIFAAEIALVYLVYRVSLDFAYRRHDRAMIEAKRLLSEPDDEVDQS
jgi:hypothetical protein